MDEVKYKVTLRYYEDESDEDFTLEIGVKITRVDEADVFDIDFARKSGDVIAFYDKFKDIQAHIFKRLNYLD